MEEGLAKCNKAFLSQSVLCTFLSIYTLVLFIFASLPTAIVKGHPLTFSQIATLSLSLDNSPAS